MFLSFFTFFSVTCHISHHTVCISHFPPFSVFLSIFQVKQCLSLIFHVFHFSRHIPGPTMCNFHFPPFSVFHAIFYVKQCLYLIFLIIFFSNKCFFLIPRFFHFFRHNPYSRVCVFPPFSVFPTIFHVLQCVFFIFQNCQFLAIFQVLQYAFFSP